jgi:hypothetical protein
MYDTLMYEGFAWLIITGPLVSTPQLNTQLPYEWRTMNDGSPLILSDESESYITTDGQSVSVSWNKAPIWGLRPDLYYCRTVAGLLMWGALSDKRTSLSFSKLSQ